jgi:hypothetical protein
MRVARRSRRNIRNDGGDNGVAPPRPRHPATHGKPPPPFCLISERLYYLTTRIWLKSVPHLNLRDEIIVFRREVADILAAMEVGDLEAVGFIRRSHISMSVKRMRQFQTNAGR